MAKRFVPHEGEPKLVAVKVGRGSKVHAGLLAGTLEDFRFGRVISETPIMQTHLCSSGVSSYAHNFRNPTLRYLGEDLTAVNCKKCLERLEARRSST